MITNNECTGCGACIVACPRSCIEMKEKWTGESVAKIDKNRCINCGKCYDTCPQNNHPPKNYPKKCYVGWSSEKKDWIYSASGGICTVIVRFFLVNGDYVYGCDYNETAELRHFRVRNVTDIERIQTSKYSQSLATDVFFELKDIISTKKNILFVGTPCQIAAIRNIIKGEYDNLF